MRCLSPFVVVQVSEAYVATGKIMAQTILVLVQAEMSLSFQMLLSLAMTDLPKISLRLISGAQLPSFVIFDPRKTNFFISSTSWPSMLIPLASFSPVQRIFVFLILRRSPAFLLSLLVVLINSSSSSLLFAMSVVSSAYLRLFIVMLPILNPLSSSFRASLMICSL